MSYLHVRVVSGRNLPAADPNGLSDPYVKVKIDGADKHKSPVIEKTLNPEWQFDSSFELSDTSADGEISFEVWDEDKLSANDFLGQLKLNVADVLKHKIVGGYFDLLDKDFEKPVGGEIYIIICVSDDKLAKDQVKAVLNGAAAKIALSAIKKK